MAERFPRRFQAKEIAEYCVRRRKCLCAMEKVMDLIKEKSVRGRALWHAFAIITVLAVGMAGCGETAARDSALEEDGSMAEFGVGDGSVAESGVGDRKSTRLNSSHR